jgi:hypothetical protein
MLFNSFSFIYLLVVTFCLYYIPTLRRFQVPNCPKQRWSENVSIRCFQGSSIITSTCLIWQDTERLTAFT